MSGNTSGYSDIGDLSAICYAEKPLIISSVIPAASKALERPKQAGMIPVERLILPGICLI